MATSPARMPEATPTTGRLAVLHHFNNHPGKRPCRRRELGDRKGSSRCKVACYGAACVEPEPANPEQAGPYKRHHKIVGMHHIARITSAATKIKSSHQRGDARRDMHNRAAGKVNCARCAKIEKEAIGSPHPVADRAVDNNAPECNEHGIAAKVHPLGKRARNQRGVMIAKLALEHGKHIIRECATA